MTWLALASIAFGDLKMTLFFVFVSCDPFLDRKPKCGVNAAKLDVLPRNSANLS